MNIGELISRSVLSLGPVSTLRDAAGAMIERRVGSAVILTDDGHPGIITERDLMRAVADKVDLDSTPVDNYMTADAILASPEWNVIEASDRMKEGGFRHLIVMDETGNIAGILSMRDLIAHLLELVTASSNAGENR